MRFLYDFGRGIGNADAKDLISHFKATTSIERIYLLPIVLQNTGWGKMDISLSSKLKCGDDFYLRFTVNHCFESESWNALYKPLLQSSFRLPVCLVIAGFTAAWASESFQIPDLVTLEVSCKALHNRHSCCTFLTVSTSRLEDALRAYQAETASTTDWSTFACVLQMHKSSFGFSSSSSNSTSANGSGIHVDSPGSSLMSASPGDIPSFNIFNRILAYPRMG